MTELIKGKYRIVREIARSNDIVYEALDTSLGRRVALKELNISPSLTGSARRERIERFYREARAAGRLNHPNIVTIFESGEENGRWFIAMEYLEGMSLRDTIQTRGALSVRESVRIACDILDALHYAHGKNVIHRDIKPDNIHLLANGQVKLTDFGIARLTEEAALTGDGQIFGTPSFMSPEQIVGKGIDHRTDLFSLGIVLYEMLSGRKPFNGDSVVSITYAIMNAPPSPLIGVPRAIEQVTLHSLEKDPLRRPASADLLRNELIAAERAPVTHGSPPVPPGYNLVSPPPPTLFGSSAPPVGYGGPPSSLGPSAYQAAQYPRAQDPQAVYYQQQAPQSQQAPPNAATGQGQQLPWAWDGSGSANPFGRRGRPMKPIVIPGWVKTVAICISIAAVIGGAIAAAVVGFLSSYDRYRQEAGARGVAAIEAKGVQAYKSGDYNTAATLFEQSRQSSVGEAQRERLDNDLDATYVQVAREAAARGDLDGARFAYEEDLKINPGSSLATQGLGRLNAGPSVSTESPVLPQPPANAIGEAPPSSSAHAAPPSVLVPDTGESTEAIASARRQRADELLNEGRQAQADGRISDAREKFDEVIETAPGTPERDDARAALDALNSSPSAVRR